MSERRKTNPARIVFIGIAGILITSLFIVGCGWDEDSLIPDPDLRAEIEYELGKSAGATITTADMATLIRIQAGRADISDLTGLEHAINLTDLYLRGSNITDISPVAELTNLTSLDLERNNITDISPVAES